MNEPMSLGSWMAIIAGMNKANGWYDEDRPFEADIALLHSEISEVFEGYRNDDRENVREELADVFIRLVDTCHRHDVDLAGEALRKIEKNRQRGYKHGGKRV